MNNVPEKIKVILKNPKIFVIIGIIGIGLIFLSSVLPSKSKTNISDGKTTDEYLNGITESVTDIVSGISGDKKPTVVITLESGVRYTYADTGESDNVNTTGGSTNQSSTKSKKSYVTVKDSDGNENALVVAECMPEIRGVAIVCEGGEDAEISEKIKNAVTAALNINSKRVYISGGAE